MVRQHNRRRYTLFIPKSGMSFVTTHKQTKESSKQQTTIGVYFMEFSKYWNWLWWLFCHHNLHAHYILEQHNPFMFVKS